MRLTTQSYRSVLIVLLFATHVQSVAAQIPGLDKSKTTPSGREQVEDPLGRTTPRSTIIAFIQAVDRQDFVSAARYMQVTEKHRRNTEQLARELKALMDRSFTQTITSISDSPDGALTDGLPLDREGVGPLTVQDKNLDVGLLRVNDPQAGPIWLISSETLDQVPGLYRLVTETWIERVMPRVLITKSLFGISLADWIVLAASLLIPFLLLVVATRGAVALTRFALRTSTRRHNVDAWHARMRWPVVIALTLVVQLSLMPLLRLPLTLRLGYARVGLVLTVIAFTWLLRRGLTLAFEEARSLARGKDYKSTQSLMLLGERLLKAVVVLVAVFAILTVIGVDTSTALAGVGIGGVALALGAQKTVENLLGGVFLISDRVLAVGDLCTVSNRQGVVEDITLRSVRLRTADQSLVSVPAGVLAQAEIENFATREKILIQTILRLRYGTTAEQLQRILEGIRTLLAENSNLENQTSRIRLVNFGREAIELELFAYVRTTDPAQFMEQREKLLLDVAGIVESAGSGFAQPTQFVYMDERASSEPAPQSERPAIRATSR
ncbi:MAG TPA: mechanosensitive ion channel domain-containing protein [Terriglobia bacterium]|nr:mechanosensitive ion channel domain-containing protein [Terriglobia bacterium]